jgi:transcriptional regulator with XRE-family HTH domain
MALSSPNRLAELRTERGLTQAEVARLVGAANPSQVSKWESGVVRPSRFYRRRLAAVFKVPVVELGVED